jgi:transcriptional regulator with XRE-family HTH domain
VEDFGKTLRQFRKQRRMTQTELAGSVGVAPAYVSQIESSLRVPSLRVVRRIAEVLHVELPTLLGPPGERMMHDHLSDGEKLDALRGLMRSIEHDLETRPAAEEVEHYPGAAGARLFSSPAYVVRSYAFSDVTSPAFLHAHPGEETVYCASGHVRVIVDAEEHELQVGGVLRLEATRPHTLLGEAGSTAISTAVPPPSVETLRRIAIRGASEDTTWDDRRSAEAG